MEKSQQTKDYFRELTTLLPVIKLLNIIHSQSHKQVCTFSINTKTFKYWELEVSSPVQIFHMDPVFFNINKYKQTTFCRLAAGQQMTGYTIGQFWWKTIKRQHQGILVLSRLLRLHRYHLNWWVLFVFCFWGGTGVIITYAGTAFSIHFYITISQHTNTFIIIH